MLHFPIYNNNWYVIYITRTSINTVNNIKNLSIFFFFIYNVLHYLFLNILCSACSNFKLQKLTHTKFKQNFYKHNEHLRFHYQMAGCKPTFYANLELVL